MNPAHHRRKSGPGRTWLVIATLLLWGQTTLADEPPWLRLPGSTGPGAGKSVVLMSGDEEYRSEESLPMLGRLLAARHGFDCTVLFAIHKTSGEIDPNTLDNIPGLEALATADLLILCTRFRDLPEAQMKHVAEYLESGRPVIGIRPAVVAFRNRPDSAFFRYSSDCLEPDFAGGFGQQVLGSTWISHHGAHGTESTRGVPVEAMRGHPILRGVGEMWGPSDVYTIRTPIPEGGAVLVEGQVLAGMARDAPRSAKATMPLAWTKHFSARGGRARVFMTTMGTSEDFEDENFRRLMVNACYWAVGMEEKIPSNTEVTPAGPFVPTPFGFDQARRG